MKCISSGKGYTSTQQEMGKGCTAGSEIALFTGSKWLDQPDPLVKPHSKIQPNPLSLSFVAMSFKSRFQRPSGKVPYYFLWKTYTERFPGALVKQNNAICCDKKTGERVRHFYVNSILDPKQYYGAVSECKREANRDWSWEEAMVLSCPLTPPVFSNQNSELGYRN